jgi:hypothetical protein
VVFMSSCCCRSLDLPKSARALLLSPRLARQPRARPPAKVALPSSTRRACARPLHGTVAVDSSRFPRAARRVGMCSARKATAFLASLRPTRWWQGQTDRVRPSHVRWRGRAARASRALTLSPGWYSQSGTSQCPAAGNVSIWSSLHDPPDHGFPVTFATLVTG